VSGIFLILQRLGKKSINEKFHSRFFREQKHQEEKVVFGIPQKPSRKKRRTKLIVLCKGGKKNLLELFSASAFPEHM
jgi:hypothetical protein